MLLVSPILLLTNVLALVLSMGFLLIMLWYDLRRVVLQYFTIFLVFVIAWNSGLLYSQFSGFLGEAEPLLAYAFVQVGFSGSIVALYALTTVMIGIHPSWFRAFALGSLLVVAIYNLFIIATQSSGPSPISFSFYLVFDFVILSLIWRYRRKFRTISLLAGIGMFVAGHSLTFLNPELDIVSVSTSLSSVGALILSLGIVRQELIFPLTSQSSQLESMHDVSLAIASQIATDTVLQEIAQQAVEWLQGDASGIFLRNNDVMELVAARDLPQQVLGTRIEPGRAVVGKVALTRTSLFLENYGRDWSGEADLPLARETFGSVICSPLIYADLVIGVLMVVTGRHGRLLGRDDVRLLEMLCSQAAVALSHGELFTNQRTLTSRLRAAHDQLRTVLASTENPVIAVSRDLHLMFINPAAEELLNLDMSMREQPITQLLSAELLPPATMKDVLRQLRKSRVFIYDISLHNRFYQCHIASLGGDKIDGWVIVLNDITQLKELDRIKSEMVRMTSHDLKNPLQAAMANMDLLREDLGENADTEVQLSMSNIEKQLTRMNRIIGGILDLERVRSGTNPTEICQPRQIVNTAVDELMQIAEDARVKLEVIIAPDISEFWGDTSQFERAVINLIENGIKFTLPGGSVVVSVYNEDRNVVFRIADTGIGIPLDLQDKIFEQFVRGRQEGAEHISGTGLGLALVKTVVESHRGRIWLQSLPNQGSTFFVSVPHIQENGTIGRSKHNQPSTLIG